jgi:hypothetical protein
MARQGDDRLRADPDRDPARARTARHGWLSLCVRGDPNRARRAPEPGRATGAGNGAAVVSIDLGRAGFIGAPDPSPPSAGEIALRRVEAARRNAAYWREVDETMFVRRAMRAKLCGGHRDWA